MQPVTYQQQRSRAKVINKIYINKNSQLSQQTKPLAHCTRTIRKYLSHVKILTNWKFNSSRRRVVPDPDLKPLNTNWQEPRSICVLLQNSCIIIIKLQSCCSRDCFLCSWKLLSVVQQFFLNQTWNLLLPPSRCKQFCLYDLRSFSCSKCCD